ncbi:Chitinase A precursor [Pseudobythopirellula maris]|uniref:Chitinase A n=1 Tax=Pseudobythopirellula maris TaxID=2527991 RepID=A0A5C5ZJD6_9BACT|nr:PKD domain-containing protein [Pseudobythopirellula maris]TWT87127.1 Chitinase A precursor [Pseudobythopirellula maris]
MARRRTLSKRIEHLERRELLSATVFEHDGIAYFLDQSDPGFARYDIASEQWIAPIDLTSASGLPTAAHADDEGLYVAYGKSVYRYGLDGSDQTPVINTQYDVRRIHTDGDLLFVNHSTGLYARVVSLDKATNTVIDTMDSYIDSIYGSSIDTESNRIFGRTSGVSPSDITYVSYSDSGDLLANAGSPYHGDYPGASQTWVFDDQSKVVDSSGTIYTTALQYANSFGSSVTDIDFVGGQVPIVLSGSTLTAYSAGILPTGSASVGGSPSDLFVNDTSAIVFEAVAGGWSETVVPLTSLSAPEPGEPVSPIGLPFTPDKIEIAANGTVLLFSKQHASIFRYDAAGQVWGETIPVVGSPLHMTYSSDLNAIYLSYDTGLIRKIDLDSELLAAEPFATLPSRPHGISAAGDLLFAADPSGAWESHYVIGSDGAVLANKEWTHASAEYVWSDATRRMYYFTQWSPRDLEYVEIGGSGSFGAVREAPQHSSAGFTFPIRVSPDGGVVVLGSGVIHDGSTLARLPQALGNSVTDIAWLGSDTHTIRTIGGVAQLQTWSGTNWGESNVAQLSGAAVSLTTVGENRLLAITTDPNGVPKMTVVDETLAVVPKPTPVAIAGEDVRVDLGSSITLDGSMSFDPDNSPGGLTYQWALAEGPGPATFGDDEAAETSFNAEVAGVYYVDLTVSDGQYSSTDTVAVTYRLNLPPIVDTTGSALSGVAQRPAVTLTAAMTTDPNNDPLTYTWSVIDAPNDAVWALGSSTGPIASLATDTPGDYEVQVTASDGVLRDSSVLTVTFAQNAAPTPDASLSDLTGVAGRHAARLDAGASTDPEGDPLTFSWEVIDGPDLSATSLSGATSTVASFAATVAGVYDVQLTANDGLASESVVVQVRIDENQKPTADASLSVTEVVFGSGSVRLDGTASFDPDDLSISYAWRVVASSNGSLPVVSSSTRSIAYLHPVEPGQYAVELQVSDGASSDTDFIIVNVIGNQAPTADASASDTVVVEGNHATLDARRSADPDGDPLAFSWTIVASSSETLPTIDDADSETAKLLRPTKGTHLVQLIVSDGIASDEDFVLITTRERYHHAWTGDFNGDGWVNAADFTLFRDMRDSAVVPYTYADATGDGWIDDADYAMWRASYGDNPGADADAARLLAASSPSLLSETITDADSVTLEPTRDVATLTAESVDETLRMPQADVTSAGGRSSYRGRVRSPLAQALVPAPSSDSNLLLAIDAAVVAINDEASPNQWDFSDEQRDRPVTTEDAILEPIAFEAAFGSRQ